MLDISGQLYTKMFMTTRNLVIMSNNKKIGNSKSYKAGYKSSKKTIYEMGI